MDRDRDRDRGGSSSSSRTVKRPKMSSSSSGGGDSGRQHRDSRDKEKEPKLVEHKSSAHEEDKEKLPTIDKKKLYESIITYEHQEAKNLDCEKALDSFLTTLSDLEDNAVDVLAVKHGHDAGGAEQKALLKMEAMTFLASLKNLNRLMKLKLKITKDEQQAHRHQVDNEHLVLQNLLYEATHLQNQVAAVQDYKGMDEKIDLINVDQFYKEAPDKVSKPEVTQNNPHLLRIARLEYEFLQRQKLTEECGALEKEKETIAKSIDEKQQKLDGVRPLLNKLLEATIPLQDFFDLDISSKKSRYDIAKYLAPPLYVLFIQSEAYQESTVGKQNFVVKIGGDVEAAKEMIISEEKEEEESEPEDKNVDADADISERRLMRKRSSFGFSLDENRKRTFQKHPLWIEWIVSSKGSESISIQFYYLVKLKIVTVKSKVRRDSSDGTVSTSISGHSDNVLNELFPDDFGLQSPNPTNTFLFRRFGIGSLSEYVKDTGKPYTWAQKVCGLDFPKKSESPLSDEAKETRASMDVSCDNIESIFKQIRKRLTNQGKLWTQLKALESRNIQVPPAAKEMLPLKHSCNFTSWETIDFEEYCQRPFARQLVEGGCVSNKNMFFKAVLQRGRAKMIALISITTDFPVVPPLFCVQLDKDGELRDATTDSSIRDLEREVNTYTPQDFGEWGDVLVSIQLHRLMTCFDVILETDLTLGESAGPSEFSQEKLLLRSTIGRNLRRPFLFVNQGAGYYTQRY